MSETKCEHLPNIHSAAIASDCLDDGNVIVDIWCVKCGKSGSTKINVEDFYFDDEDCEEKS